MGRIQPANMRSRARAMWFLWLRFFQVASVLPAASVDVFVTIRRYALAKPCEANNARTTSSEPDHFALVALPRVDALRAVRGPGIDCKHGTGSSSLLPTNASHLSRNSCSPAARGAHNNIAALTLAAKRGRATSLPKKRAFPNAKEQER